jgi:NAD(P)-dependent dehydrogenase (short-subunit alcohol dehydrogenase family)
MTTQRRVVAIMGAGGALGAAISQRLAGEPDTDLVLSDVSAATLEATVAGLSGLEGSVETMLADVSEFDQVESVVSRAVERLASSTS